MRAPIVQEAIDWGRSKEFQNDTCNSDGFEEAVCAWQKVVECFTWVIYVLFHAARLKCDRSIQSSTAHPSKPNRGCFGKAPESHWSK